mmetsp:Transcript_7123/g.25096  ORF Transcript_7123/g.25096 Transcript_7123/m.25096 type:complete len:126 (+) Transcript_7123:196-573(+)
MSKALGGFAWRIGSKAARAMDQFSRMGKDYAVRAVQTRYGIDYEPVVKKTPKSQGRLMTKIKRMTLSEHRKQRNWLRKYGDPKDYIFSRKEAKVIARKKPINPMSKVWKRDREIWDDFYNDRYYD